MASIEEGLLEAVKRLEVQGRTKNEAVLPELAGLEIIVNNVNETLRPSSKDYDDRRQLVRTFKEIARELYGDDACPIVKEFGSFLMQIFSSASDLDLSIDFMDEEIMVNRSLQIKTLRKFTKKLYVLQARGIFTNIQVILSARVPVVKVTDCRTGVECDLSVGNLDGIARSQFLFMVSAIDERFSKLGMLMKAWAKAHDINSSKDGTMSSWSLLLLAAFHLQTRDIPILPPFSAILKDGLGPNDVQKYIHRFQDYGKNNKESVSHLFVSLLVKMESVEKLWSDGLCVSTYEGSWIRNKLGCLSIEDFVDRSQNACRSLESKKMMKIYHAIKHSLTQISFFSKGTIDAAKLKHILFEEDPVKTSKIGASANFHRPLQPNPSTGKRKEQRKTKRLVAKYLGEDKMKTESDSPSNVEVPAPSTGSSRAKTNTPTSFRETSQSWEIPRLTYQPQAAPSAPHYLSSPYPDLNSSNQGTGVFLPERRHYDTRSNSASVHSSFHNLSTAAPRDMRPYSGLPIYDTGGYRHEGIGLETHSYAPHNQPHFPAFPFPNTMGFGAPYGHHTVSRHLAPPYAHSDVSRDSHHAAFNHLAPPPHALSEFSWDSNNVSRYRRGAPPPYAHSDLSWDSHHASPHHLAPPRAHDDREIHGHRLYRPHVHPSSMHFPRY